MLLSRVLRTTRSSRHHQRKLKKRVIYRTRRFYSKVNKTSNIVDVKFERGLESIVLPLTNDELCKFPIHRHEVIKDLIHDIRDEDDKIHTIYFTDSKGERLSHSISLNELMEKDFKVVINETEYVIRIPTKPTITIGENLIGEKELKNLLRSLYFQRIREKIMREYRHHISFKEFEEWCKDYGLNEKETRLLIRSLHHCGYVFNFFQDEQLKDIVFLKPDILLNSLKESLNLKLVRRDDLNLQHRYDSIIDEYKTLNKQKEELDHKADRRASALLWLGFIYLAVQFGILARMVWWEFNWDIMEPITYIVTFGTFFGGYTFFIFTNQDYTYDNLRLKLKQRRLRTLYLRHGFNWKRWNALNNEVIMIRNILQIKP